MRRAGAVTLLLGVFLTGGCDQSPSLLVRQVDTPEPRNMVELRAASNLAPKAQCDLPPLAHDTAFVEVAGPDSGLTLRLPPQWKFLRVDTVPRLVRGEQYVTVLTDSGRGRIRAHRVPRASEGRTFVPNVRPIDDCELGNEDAGSIWTLYPEDTVVSGDTTWMGHVGVADMITPAGKRYKIWLSAATPAERDRLAQIITDAALSP